MRSQQVRLAFSAVYWRIALAVLAGLEANLWEKIPRKYHITRPGPRFHLWVAKTPMESLKALGIAFLITLALALVVRYVAGPLVARWHSPRRRPGDFGGSDAFHLGPGERALAESRARRAEGGRWAPGTLVRTDRRVWFFPDAWDAPPWSIGLDAVRDLGTRPAPRAGLGFVEGLPDRFRIAAGPGRREVFAVPDPDLLLTWAERPPVANA